MNNKYKVSIKSSKERGSYIATYRLALVGLFCALVAVSAFIRVPTPVMPFTLQIFVVLLAPMLLGLSTSFMSILLYIIIGLVGFPIFASGGGPAYILQPSFGFLIGYLLSTIPCALIIKGGQRLEQIEALSPTKLKFLLVLRNMIAGLSALFVIYAVGITYFWINMHLVQLKEISFLGAIIVMSPFFIPDLFKCIMAVAVSYKLRKVVHRISDQ